MLSKVTKTARLVKDHNTDGCRILHSLLQQAKRLIFTNMPLVKPPFEEGMLVWVKGITVKLAIGHPTHCQDEVVTVKIPKVILIGIVSIRALEELLDQRVLCGVVVTSNLEAS